ncbi:hypothetical protein FJZ31_34300 [Candidatus Poribacteria bacterium]|nr:hypothetical protein [Candidatus Poribacteria bacterium]
MNREEMREIVIARLIANTCRKKRPNSLIEIARDIRWLENDLGSLKAVSETIGISTDMLGQFLSVERLSPEVQNLVAERKIDLVNIVHYMRNFDSEAQQVIAREVIEGRLSGEDIRALAPLQKSLPHLTIEQLISRIQKSRDVKVYVAYFRVPPEFKNSNELKGKFEKIVGETEIVSFTVKDYVGTLELTSAGLKKLREAAKKRNLSLRKFVDMIVSE